MKQVITDIFRLLALRATGDEMAGYTRAHLATGLVCTCLVGIGRYWDNPRVGIAQHLGVGSVVYVFLLAFVIWLVIKPLRPKNGSYFNILTFISLVSPPAILYAIPVEMIFRQADAANAVNALFLLIVAVWRILLLMYFLRRATALSGISTLTAAMLPITAIVWMLGLLNLERAVYDIMGGFVRSTPNDSAYAVLMVIVLLSTVLLPIVLIAYIMLAYLAYARGPEDHERIFPEEVSESDPE